MASPDLSKYVDLTVYDLQPQEIYDTAVQYAATSLPEWQPVPGSVEDALLQAAASMSGQLLGAINRLPNSVVEALLKLYGVERNSGTSASAIAEITFIDGNGHTIPAGTNFGYRETIDGNLNIYIFEIEQAVTAPIGVTTATVGIRGIANQRYPNLMAGDPLEALSALSSIDSIALDSDLLPGSDPETDEEYIARSRAAFGLLSDALTTPSQMDNYALSQYASVFRSKTYSRVKAFRLLTDITSTGASVTATLDTNPTSSSASSTIEIGDTVRVLSADNGFNGTFTVAGVNGDASAITWVSDVDAGSAANPGVMMCFRFQDDDFDIGEDEYQFQNGYVTTYVCGVGGASVNDSVLNQVREGIEDRAIAGLIVGTDHATVVNVGINVEVIKQPAVPLSQVQAAVLEALDQYVNPDSWSWDNAIYRNEIIALIDRVPGVVRVVDVTLDDSLSGNLAEVVDGGAAIEFNYFGLLPVATSDVDVVA